MTERIFDYHNNDLVADLDHFLKDQATGLYTDWELLCRVAQIVNKRRAPTYEMTDCQTGLCYGGEGWARKAHDEAMKIAMANSR